MIEEYQNLLKETRRAALKLAEYASYSEIVGAIGLNRNEIREWSDKVFELNLKLQKIEQSKEYGPT